MTDYMTTAVLRGIVYTIYCDGLHVGAHSFLGHLQRGFRGRWYASANGLYVPGDLNDALEDAYQRLMGEGVQP